MLKLIISLTVVLLLGCATSDLEPDSYTEEKLSLNGNWKFHAIIGDGSDYRQIKVGQNDIVIDNSDVSKVEINGTWAVNTEGSRGSEFFGLDYLTHQFEKGDPSTNVRFLSNFVPTGYYEHFIYYPFAVHLTAQINVTHSDGISTQHINQRNRCNQWISLGIFKIENGETAFVEVTAITGALVSADAVMLRHVSNEDMGNLEREKTTVYLTGFDDSQWTDLMVPGHWGMINEYSNYTGKGWYRKKFNLPKGWEKGSDENIRLQFDGVFHVARVFFNGKFIGRHQGGFTPFEMDVTEHVNFGSENVVAVEADNNYLVGATWNWGGITRDVHLEKTNNVRINYHYIHADPDLENGTTDLNIKVRVENNSNTEKAITVESRIVKEEQLLTIIKDIKIAANSTQELEMSAQLRADQVELWHFDTPHLYQITSRISAKGRTLHSKSDRFGIRKFEVNESQMLLNGESVRLVGFNRVSDHRYWGSSEPQELVNLDVDLMKNAGANFMRIMHGAQNKKLLDRCDEKGILIFEEVNVRELTNPEFAPPEYPLVKQWLKEMIERDVNHPCIVGWSVGNELKMHFDFVETTINYVKEELDPNRLVTCVSNTGYRNNDNTENDPIVLSDLIMQNIYQKDPGKVMDTIHRRWPSQPMFISEFGVERFTNASHDNDVSALGDWYDHFRMQRPYVTGASIWTFNDYKSPYAQTLEDENRAWGMVDAWRNKRRAFHTHQKENSPITDIVVMNFDLKNRKFDLKMLIREADDFPSYSMNNYSWKLQFRDKESKVLTEKKVALPDLRPQDGHWRGIINWDAFEGDPFDMNLLLLTPNGYTRYTVNFAFQKPVQPSIETVISGNQSARVFFEKDFGTYETYASYSISGKEFKTTKTIANYIDIPDLENGKTYSVQLIACNDKGESSPSATIKVTPINKDLPPIIYDAFIADDKLVVGYSGEKGDIIYTMRYGTSADNLVHEVSTHSRGMMVADLNEQRPTFLKLKRNNGNGDSKWSNVIVAKKKW